MAGGVIRPWVSQLNQAVGGGGQAASFKSASDFMAPGGGDNGLAALANGLGQLSGAMYEIGMRDRQERQQIALLEDVQNFRRASDQFMTDYMAENQGANAGEASAAYQAWSAENFTPLREKWAAVSPETEYYIVQHAGGIVTGGLDSMLGYQRGETEKWYGSAVGAELARLNDMASRPDATQAQLESAWGGVKDLTRAYYRRKGLDSGAAEVEANQQFRKLSATKALSTFNALLGTDPDAAATFLDEGLTAPEGGGLTMPLGGTPRVSSPFGMRTAPKTPKGRGSSNHQGIDYAVPVGTPVMSVGGGKVVFVGDTGGGYGLQVKIDHGDGRESWYNHLDSAKGLKAGDVVDQGQQIALSGNSGKSTGPHLDFKIKVNGQFVDPTTVLGGEPKSRLSSLFTPEQIAEMKNKAVQAQDDRFVKDMTGNIANAFQNNTELEIASSINLAFEEIRKVGDPDRQNAMSRSLQQNIDFHQKTRDAADMEGTEKFLAETEGLSPFDRKKKLQEWEGLSRKAKADMAKAIDEGTINKTTPENQEAYDRIRVEIDNRQNGRDPMKDTEVKALAQQNGLTVAQAKGLEDYRAKGGMAGVDGFAGKVNAIYKELGRGKNDAPSGFVDLVARNLPSGKTATPEELRKAVATLMLSAIKGESMDAGLFNWDIGETYDEAARKGRAGDWLPKIDDDDERAELSLEVKARIEAGEFPDNSVSDEDLRDYKRVYKMGLPPRPPRTSQTRTNAALPTLSDLQRNIGR